MLSPKHYQLSPGNLQEVVREGGGTFQESTAADLSTFLAPTALGQTLTRRTAPHSGAEERGALKGAAFAQHPDLLLSPMPKLVEQTKGPAEACTPCVCACRSPGQNARGQRLLLLKNNEVTGSHSCSPVPSQGC